MPFADNQYSVKNSATFVPQLKPFNRNSEKLFMASFDVESLYTNVPLTKTIEIITNIVFPNQAQSFLGLNRLSFTKLLDIATRNCFFYLIRNCTDSVRDWEWDYLTLQFLQIYNYNYENQFYKSGNQFCTDGNLSILQRNERGNNN